MARLIDVDTWQEIGETLRRNRLRTALTALGVFWGVFMLVAMVGFGTGLENGISNRFSGHVTNAAYLWGRRSTMPYLGNQPGRRVQFTMADVEALEAELPPLARIAPRSQLGGWRDGNSVQREGKVGNYSVMGDVPIYREVQPMVMRQGRFINELDLEERRKVAVIGDRVVEELFEPGEAPVGKLIEVQGVWFTVVGWIGTERADDRGDRYASTVHLPITTFQQAFNEGNRVRWLTIVGAPGDSAADAEARARAVLAKRHGVHPDDEPAMGSYNAEEEFLRVQNTFLGVNALVWFVGTMTLLGGVVGVSNIMLVTVRERTREIGLRRALGATRRDIAVQVLAEAVLLTAAAGYTGVVVGVAAMEVLGRVLGEDHEVLGSPQVSVQVVLVATGLLTLAGVVAGWFPARRAARIHPVEALRAE